MVSSENEIAISILQTINQKREEIKNATCRLMEIKDDISQIVEITQLIQKILNNVHYSYTPHSGLVETRAMIIFHGIEGHGPDRKRLELYTWNNHISPAITRLCMDANEWNPIDIHSISKASKVVINLNFPKNINLASLIGKQTVK